MYKGKFKFVVWWSYDNMSDIFLFMVLGRKFLSGVKSYEKMLLMMCERKLWEVKVFRDFLFCKIF